MGMEACREERRLKMPPSLCYYFGNSRQRERWCRRMDAERVGWGGGGYWAVHPHLPRAVGVLGVS